MQIVEERYRHLIDSASISPRIQKDLESFPEVSNECFATIGIDD